MRQFYDIDDFHEIVPCADITTKNPEKAKRYLKNFDVVEKKMKS